MTFEVNGHVYPRFYLLIDGIYPQWSCFVLPCTAKGNEKTFYKNIRGCTKMLILCYKVCDFFVEIIVKII